MRTQIVVDTKGAELNVTPGATTLMDFKTNDATGFADISSRSMVLATASGADAYWKSVNKGRSAPTVSATNGHIIPQDSTIPIPVGRTQDLYIFGTGGKLTLTEYF